MALTKVDISMLEDVGGANKLVKLDSNAKIPAASAAGLSVKPGPLTSASDPTISSNKTLGTEWLNSASGEMYICTDATTGANVWTNVGDGAGNVEPESRPRQGKEYGYCAGGGWPRNDMIQKYSFTSDGNAVDTTANLLEGGTSGTSNTCSVTYGYRAGHQSDSANVNVIEKWPFASSANATDVGDLSTGALGPIGTSTQTYGYASGGGGPTWPATSNEIQRWSFASGTQNAVDVGDMTGVRKSGGGTMTETYGYSHGGQVLTPYGSPSGTSDDTIEKFAFGASTTSTDVGNLTQRNIVEAGCQSLTHGYVIAGSINAAPSGTNKIEKYSFSSDGNSVDIGNTLDTYCKGIAAASQTDYGYGAGGQSAVPPAPYLNRIQKISFTSDGNSVDVGDLAAARGNATGAQV